MCIEDRLKDIDAFLASVSKHRLVSLYRPKNETIYIISTLKNDKIFFLKTIEVDNDRIEELKSNDELLLHEVVYLIILLDY